MTITIDAVGNRLSETTAAGTTSYGYDAANRLANVNETEYQWDDNGNLLNDGTYAYTYDHANRLITINNQGSVISSYSYNGQGDRLTSTTGGILKTYTLDLNAGAEHAPWALTQVLADGAQTYLYGRGRLEQESAASIEYFIGDALGSVRQLVDEAGEVRLNRSYEPYGEELASDGEAETDYAFTGENYDPQTGLVYLRARYYASEDGRFISRDTWLGNYQQPISYNKWAYANSNPIMYFDPSGRNPAAAILAVILPPLIGIAASMAAGAAAGAIYGACIYEWAIAGECGCELQAQAMSMTKWDWIGVHALSGGIIGGYSAAFIAAGPIGEIALGVSIVAISTADMIPAINELKQVGVTWCTVTRVVFDVAGLALGAMGIVSGVRAWRAGGSILYWAESYPAITPPTNRAGLRTAMGDPPDGFVNPQAHHNLPWTFRNWFAGEGRGLNVNDPIYGRWVEGTPPGPHQTWSQLYEQEWATFIDKNPNATRPQVLTFLNKLLSSGKYPSK